MPSGGAVGVEGVKEFVRRLGNISAFLKDGEGWAIES